MELTHNDALQSELEEVATWTDVDRLTTYLEDAFSLSLKGVLCAAAAVKRLRELGAEITVGAGVVPFLERIAHGQVDPQLFLSLQGRPHLLKKVATLPLPLQKEFAADRPVKVWGLGGPDDVRDVPVSALRPSEISQVFDDGRLRSDGEQIGWLRERLQKQAPAHEPIDEPAIKLDRKHKRVWIPNARYLSEAEIVGLLAELRTHRRKSVGLQGKQVC
jgi:hypothetical protein